MPLNEKEALKRLVDASKKALNPSVPNNPDDEAAADAERQAQTIQRQNAGMGR